MGEKKSFSIVFICFVAFNMFAQKDTLNSVHKLREVVIYGKNKPRKNVAIKSVHINNKAKITNSINITNLLRYNSPIVFRDYGNGGISTARFRGTSASNTLVLWNDIPINAFGTGQTDFNTLSVNLTDNIMVQSGGASAEYGSGAIGGLVHLKDKLYFKKTKSFHLFTSYGSYTTSSNFFKTVLADKKWHIKLATSFNFSENNYPYIDARYKNEDGSMLVNENGSYKNYGVNFSLAYKFSEDNWLAFYSTKYYGNRFFSDGLPNPSAGSERNEDFNQRNLLQWEFNYSSLLKQQISIAYLTQEYRYYANKDTSIFNFGNSKTTHLNYTLQYKPSNLVNYKYKVVYENIVGNNSKIDIKKRNSVAFVGTVNLKLSKKITTTLQARQELNSDFKVPFSSYIGLSYNVLKNIHLLSNYSSNYRVPTFNELYWPSVGNLHLIPENSHQGELGISYKSKNVQLHSTIFYIHTSNKIFWLPRGGGNLWKPKNIDDVANKGVETSMEITKKIENHLLHFTANYTYTRAINLENEHTLPYAPKHLFNFNFRYNFNRYSIVLQSLHQSKVYTNEINLDFYSLKPVHVQNIGVNIDVYKQRKKGITIGGMLHNIFNKVYYFSNLRPMPGRNFNININYKF